MGWAETLMATVLESIFGPPGEIRRQIACRYLHVGGSREAGSRRVLQSVQGRVDVVHHARERHGVRAVAAAQECQAVGVSQRKRAIVHGQRHLMQAGIRLRGCYPDRVAVGCRETNGMFASSIWMAGTVLTGRRSPASEASCRLPSNRLPTHPDSVAVPNDHIVVGTEERGRGVRLRPFRRGVYAGCRSIGRSIRTVQLAVDVR